MKLPHLIITTACIALLSACSDQTTAPVAENQMSDEAYIAQSRETVLALKTALMTELQTAIKANGVAAAIQVCQSVAQPITDSVTAGDPNIKIARTALRYRNPANAPDETSAAILEDWTRSVETDGPAPAPIVTREGRSVIVHHPIVLQEAACLMCHGDPDTFAPEVTQALQKLYPDDVATGFEIGDLRGAFRVAEQMGSFRKFL